MKWVKASDRLGEFHDSDIPDWKFWHPGFCKVDGKPAEGGFFRKDTAKKSIAFSYVYIQGSEFREEIKEKDFDRIEWLDEQSPSSGSAQVLVDALEKIIAEPGDWDNKKQIARRALGQFNYPHMGNVVIKTQPVRSELPRQEQEWIKIEKANLPKEPCEVYLAWDDEDVHEGMFDGTNFSDTNHWRFIEDPMYFMVKKLPAAPAKKTS